MRSTTGIELGPDSSVLVRARLARAGTAVSAFHLIERSEWPTHDVAIADALRTLRRRKRFPRRARVVIWGMSEGATLGDPMVRAVLKPLLAAGFRVQSVMSPPQALAALSLARPRGIGNAAVWLALNMHGAAIAIVQGGELLFSRTFDWVYTPGIVGTKAELLQRYSLVAHLAPEVRRGIAMVRTSRGVAVDLAVTCGDLPELRSLTMPLIEELDLEVETLDSAEGLVAVSGARIDRFVESAPTLRLACAAATAPLQRRRPESNRSLRVAAGLAIIAAAVGAGYTFWPSSSGGRPAENPVVSRTPLPAASKPAVPPVRPAQAQAPTPLSRGPAVSVPPPAGSAPVPTSSVPAPTASTASPLAVTPQTAASTQREVTQRAVTEEPPPQIAATPESLKSEPTRNASRFVPPEQPPPRTAVEGTPAEAVGVRATPTPTLPRSAPSAVAHPPAPERRPAPLRAPIPVIDSILISHDRRLAIVGGSIVGVGDSVGPRVVVAIDRSAVVFREPSGFELRVSLRHNLGGV